MCSHLPNPFTVVLGGGVPLTPKSKLLNEPYENLATTICFSRVYMCVFDEIIL